MKFPLRGTERFYIADSDLSCEIRHIKLLLPWGCLRCDLSGGRGGCSGTTPSRIIADGNFGRPGRNPPNKKRLGKTRKRRKLQSAGNGILSLFVRKDGPPK